MDKLAVSNIAWTGNNERFFELLASNGVSGVEVAPGKVVGGWDDLNMKTMAAYRKQCQSFGLQIPSFQAFLFGKPELQLLSSDLQFKKFIEHMKFIAELAKTAGATVLVYGAPKSRLLLDYNAKDGFLLAKERLAILAETCWGYEVSIGLEAVPEIYGGEIIQSYKDSLQIVKNIDHPGLVFHLDTGCTFLNDESIGKAIDEVVENIAHFHISQPQLSDFSKPAEYHLEASESLNKYTYKGWKCIEMLETDNSLYSIKNAIEYIKYEYGTTDYL